MTTQRKTPRDISAHKNQAQPLVCLTAYTAPMTQIMDAHCDMLLVGDSLGMTLYGLENTLGVTLDMMINHGRAVATYALNACVVVDMPYGTYEHNAQDALANAQRIMNETGCDAVKLEGGVEIENTIKTLVDNGVPVIGHIGLKPQSVEKEGGYKVKGKTDTEIVKLLEDAHALERAGASAFVIEGTIEKVAAHLSKNVRIPTIGIGASAACDGQILVTEDMIGLTLGHVPKFAKQYAQIAETIETAVTAYAQDVRSRTFPSAEYTYKGKA